MSKDRLTFANFDLLQASPQDIYSIGAPRGTGGVIREMGLVFDYELAADPDVANLGGLIAAVGPAKELQQNIDRVHQVLGTGQEAVDVAREWVESSGLLLPVQRSFLEATAPIPQNIDVAVITGGVRNWMNRRFNVLADLTANHTIGRVVLAASNREMKSQEGADVRPGMTEADYIEGPVAAGVANIGLSAEVVRVDSAKGEDVMAEAAQAVSSRSQSTPSNILVVSNAGAWVQAAGQFRRAMVREAGDPSFDMRGGQLFVASDEFRLGTGAEPTATHQNPFSALGQIVRNAQELARQISY